MILARREGVGLHEAILAACRRARFTPKLAYTPSLIGTVLNYAEAGAGVGVIPDSVYSSGERKLPLSFHALAPMATVDLVMVWSDKDEPPPATAFRNLVKEWKEAGRLWTEARAVGHERGSPRHRAVIHVSSAHLLDRTRIENHYTFNCEDEGAQRRGR